VEPAHDRPRVNPSAWVERFAPLVPPGTTVLDIACGGGRHTRFFLARDHPVVAVDRDLSAMADLSGTRALELIEADLETGAPLPFVGREFGGVVVTNYLWRPILADLVAAVAPGGTLLYETFAAGNELVGRPTNPAYLLRPGELLEVVRGSLQVVAFEDVSVDDPRPAVVQRIAARRHARREPRTLTS
jgi:SAM-dependent methyltransferase